MVGSKKIKVEVAYATPELQKIFMLEVEQGTSIETVLDRSGVLEEFPEIDLMKQKVGIFGKLRKLTDAVCDGDRVEIYRGLLADPKEARMKRVKEQRGGNLR
jgi:putative ubiquitin-RnfH superfamily antitoxin RatB of RatAB toxin-antitoxin module